MSEIFSILLLVNEYTKINVEYVLVPSPRSKVIFSIQRKGISSSKNTIFNLPSIITCPIFANTLS